MKSGPVTPTSSGGNAESNFSFHFMRKSPRILNLPPEILGIIYSYLDEEDKTPITVCNLALVCQCFMHYFTSDKVWNMKNCYLHSHVLLQNSVTYNIWESNSINTWYKNLQSPKILPSEVWAHRSLLVKVLTRVNVLCAPSREDFESYTDDLVIPAFFIRKMVHGDCFSYFSKSFRGSKNFALSVIMRFPEAIRFCTPELLNDRDFIKQAISINGRCLEYLGDYCADSELVVAASRMSIDVLDHAKGQAKKDMERIHEHLSKKRASFSVNTGTTQSFLGAPSNSAFKSPSPFSFFPPKRSGKEGLSNLEATLESPI